MKDRVRKWASVSEVVNKGRRKMSVLGTLLTQPNSITWVIDAGYRSQSLHALWFWFYPPSQKGCWTTSKQVWTDRYKEDKVVQHQVQTKEWQGVIMRQHCFSIEDGRSELWSVVPKLSNMGTLTRSSESRTKCEHALHIIEQEPRMTLRILWPLSNNVGNGDKKQWCRTRSKTEPTSFPAFVIQIIKFDPGQHDNKTIMMNGNQVTLFHY